jgi:translocation and assembly module TamB
MPDSGIPLQGTASVAIEVDWPSGSLPAIAATVDEIDLDLQDDPVRLLGPARLDLSSEGLEVRDLYLAHRDDRVFMRWGIGSDGSVRGNATGTIDALLLRFLVPEWEPAGRATGVVEMLGTIDRPRFEGIAEISQGSFRLPGGQTILSGIDGTILLSENDVVVDGSGFRFMQGRGVANGRINWRAGIVSLDLAGEMNGLRYPVLPGITARLSGPWRLSGPADDLHISGDLRVDRASLDRREAPSLLLLEWFGGAPSPPTEGGPSLDLRVEADQTIDLRNPFVRLVGSASLHVTGNTSQPGLVGKVEFEEGGEVTLQNLRYDLERGTFTFSDPDRIDPSVELQLRTWVQNYQVTLRVSGTSDRLIPQVTSSPPLPQEEVYALLAMGHRSDAFGSGAMGVGVASTILSQQIASELDRRTKFVLPHVRVDPFAESTTSGPSARVTVVQQLASNWTVTLQSSLSAERAEVIVSRWYLAPGIFLEASRQLDGSYGIDIKMRRPY